MMSTTTIDPNALYAKMSDAFDLGRWEDAQALATRFLVHVHGGGALPYRMTLERAVADGNQILSEAMRAEDEDREGGL